MFMKKFVKGVSVLAALAMVNPATIVSATTATGQPQSDVTQNTNETATTVKPIDRMHYMNNIFATSPSYYIAYSGRGNLDLRLYSSEHTQYLARMYIVMSKGLTVDGGLAAMQVALANYRNAVTIHANGDNDGTLSIQQLANTADGREVYEISPGIDNYVIDGQNTAELPMTIPIRSADKSSGLTEILMNAMTKEDMTQDVLFAGSGDGQNVIFDNDSSYPQTAAQNVGIIGPDDQYVHGMANRSYQKKMVFFTPKVTDHYQVIDPSVINKITQKPVIKETIPSTTGDAGTTYSRVGLVDTLEALKLDSSVYDEKSLAIDQGDLKDTSVILTPLNSFTNNSEVPLNGQTYTITVKRFAKDVTVKYVDQDGKAITDANGDTTETLTGDVGDDYQSVHKDIAGYTATVGEDNQTGKFTDTPQMITYHYTKIPVPAKNITVNYEDAEGNQLATSETLTGNVDDPYATVKKEIMGYAFKKVANDNATGTFSEAAQTVTYVYAKIGKDVTVNYVDADGKKLAESKTLSGNVGDKVNAEEAKVAGYAMIKTNATADDVFTDDAQIITYHYAKIGKDVTVNYVDVAGKELATSKTLSSNVGDKVNSEAVKVDGYAMVKTNATADDVFTDDAQTITYHYAKIGKDVTVNYVDADGKELATSKTLSGNVGDKVNAEEAKVAGYAMVKTNATADDVFTDKAQTITYHYAKIGKDVTVNYEDESGNKIAESKTFTGNVGDSYTAVKRDVSGYVFKKVTGNETGTLGETAQTVTYVYAQIGKAVTVNYVNADGKQLANSEEFTGNVGEAYHAVQKDFDGYHFKRVEGNPDGLLTDQRQTVTYHYAKPAADVTVKYIYTKGSMNGQVQIPLADSVVKQGDIGDSYTTDDPQFAGYHLSSIKGAEATGNFTSKAQTVIYYYAKDPVKAADWTINYVDEAGKPLADSKVLSGNIDDFFSVLNDGLLKQIEGYFPYDSTGALGVNLTADPQTTTLIYKKLGAVTVNYEDESGKSIADSETLTGKVLGDKYQTKQKEISGYTFKVVSGGDETGMFLDKDITVTYVYTKDPVPAKPVTVNYQDASGKQLAGSETFTGNVDDPYTAVKKDITGYILKKVTGNETGTLSDTAQTVTYVYAKIGKDVTVNYVDAAGKKIAESKTLSGNVGDKVNAEEAKIDATRWSKPTRPPMMYSRMMSKPLRIIMLKKLIM